MTTGNDASRVRPARAGFAAPALIAILLILTACGADGPEGDPAEVLASAQQHLEDTSGVHIRVSSDGLSEEVSGLVGADGVLTADPAFEGTVKLQYGEITADIPVISVGGIVYAQLPFTTGYDPIDPAEYGAPDPAQLLSAGEGIARWLASAIDVEEGDQSRDGREVLTQYTGSLSGTVVADVIPGADAESTFEVTFAITAEGVLREADVSGPFYEDEQDVTYLIGLDDYGTQRSIQAP